MPTLLRVSVLAVLLTSLALTSYAADEPSSASRDVYLWPLLTYDADEGESDLRVLIPIFQYKQGPGVADVAVRPFFIWHDTNTKKRSLDAPWPIVRYSRNRKGEVAWRAFPVFWDADHGGDRDLDVFPLVWTWWNRDKDPEESRGIVIAPAWTWKEYGANPEWAHGLAPGLAAWGKGKKVGGVWVGPFCVRGSRDGTRTIDAPWPVGRVKWDKNEPEHSGRFFPVFWDYDEDGRRDFDVFPLVWSWWDRDKTPGESKGVVAGPVWSFGTYGDDAGQARGVAPVWWTWDNNLSHGFWFLPVWRWRETDDPDNGGLGVFPFYYDWHSDDRRGTWAMPVFWLREDGETQFLTVLPLYWQWKGSTVLFPFYWSFDDGQSKVVFPFFGYGKDKNSDWLTVLGPVYATSRQNNDRTHNVLWPILQWGGDGENNSRFRIWPLFGRSREWYEDEKFGEWTNHMWALWPFVWKGRWRERIYTDKVGGRPSLTESSFDSTWESPFPEQENKAVETHDESWWFDVVPLYWSGGSRGWWSEKGEQMDTYHNRLLPFYTYNRDGDKKVFTALWPVWRTSMSDEEDQYSVLWRLADARFYGDGDKRVSVLWRGYRDERRGDIRKLDMFPFISYRRWDPDTTRFQFLAGLFQLGKQDGQRHMRLLYSPKIPLGKTDE